MRWYHGIYYEKLVSTLFMSKFLVEKTKKVVVHTKHGIGLSIYNIFIKYLYVSTLVPEQYLL